MKVRIKNYRGEVATVELEKALKPNHDYAYHQVERVAELADNTASSLGRLSALLVEKGVMSLEEALVAMDAQDIIVD